MNGVHCVCTAGAVRPQGDERNYRLEAERAARESREEQRQALLRGEAEKRARAEADRKTEAAVADFQRAGGQASNERKAREEAQQEAGAALAKVAHLEAAGPHCPTGTAAVCPLRCHCRPDLLGEHGASGVRTECPKGG